MKDFISTKHCYFSRKKLHPQNVTYNFVFPHVQKNSHTNQNLESGFLHNILKLL